MKADRPPSEPTEFTAAERARGLANGDAARRRTRAGVPPLGNSSDRVPDDDEWEFCRAVEAFKARTGIRFPTLSQYLYVLKELGYRKPGV